MHTRRASSAARVCRCSNTSTVVGGQRERSPRDCTRLPSYPGAAYCSEPVAAEIKLADFFPWQRSRRCVFLAFPVRRATETGRGTRGRPCPCVHLMPREICLRVCARKREVKRCLGPSSQTDASCFPSVVRPKKKKRKKKRERKAEVVI